MKTPGEILKEIRQKYKLSQKECSSNDIDRSLISHIESGKFSMSEDVAKIISNNINSVLEKRNIDKTIDYLEFYEDKYAILVEATGRVKALNEYMEKNNIKQFEEEMVKLEEIIDEYFLPEIKLRVLEIAASMARKQCDFFKGYMYALRALDIAVFIKDENVQINLYKLITYFLYSMEKYEEVIKVTTVVLKRYKSNFNKNVFLYNCGICMLHEKRFNEAIDVFNEIDTSENLINRYQLADIKLSLAVCYKNIGKNDVSLEILHQVLDIFRDEYSYHAANSYNLIMNNYIVLNKPEMVRLYAEKLIGCINPDDDSFVYPQILMELGEGLCFLKENAEALKYYLLSIRSSVMQKRYKMVSEVVNKIYKLFETGELEYSNDQIYNMLPLIGNTELNDNNIIIFLSMIKNFNSRETVDHYIKDLTHIIKDRS